MLTALHIPVLLPAVLKYLGTNKTFLDGTLGYGGHAKALLEANEKMSLIACDKDEFALDFSKKALEKYKDRIKLYKGDFKDILEKIDSSTLGSILLDLGMSSYQLDTNERGFKLDSDFLDMRMDKDNKINAKTIVNSYDESELERIFKDYAELNFAKKIARDICQYRAKGEINSIKELVSIIGNHKKTNRRVSEAVLICQALRIEVNQELNALSLFLKKLAVLRPGGLRVGIISFHSLEDRIVKQSFKMWSKNCICPSDALRCSCQNNHALGKILTKKPIIASKDETLFNSRSKCAKFRVFEFEDKLCE